MPTLTDRLEALGFTRETGPRGEKGYTRTFPHKDNSEVLWVTIDPNTGTIYLYNEYDVGGMIWDDKDETDLNETLATDKTFYEWLDTYIDFKN